MSFRSGDVVTLCPPPAAFPGRAAVRLARVVLDDDELVVRYQGRQADQRVALRQRPERRPERRPEQGDERGDEDGFEGVFAAGVVAGIGEFDARAPVRADRTALALLRCSRSVQVVPSQAPGARLGDLDETDQTFGENLPAESYQVPIGVPVEMTGGAASLEVVIPLEHWTPGHRPIPRHRTTMGRFPLTSGDVLKLLNRTRLAPGLADAGVPVRLISGVDGAPTWRWARRQRVNAVLADPELPRWIFWARALLLPVATLV